MIHLIEALLYQKLDEEKVRCYVCHHHCLIKSGQRGICGVRENQEGVLFALNYGKTIAMQIDPIEKKPIYHFLPGTWSYSLATVGCNFHCLWCQNNEISQIDESNKQIRGKNITPETHVNMAIKNNCQSISYTYSEPTIFLEYALDIMKLAKKSGLKNIWVSNGYMSSETLDLILPLVDAMNVDLKCFNDSLHKKFCGGSVKPILENLKRINSSSVHLEITTLLVTYFNDNVDEVSKIASFIADLNPKIPWHITRFYPAWKMLDKKPTNISILKKSHEIGKNMGIESIHIGNV
jgi:pyruvate formate lyase activating enzyme